MARSNRPIDRAVYLVSIGLVVAAVVKELRLPAEERTWHGQLAGLVPYDFRLPTPARLKAGLWAPDNPRLLVPHVFGVGWSLNLGRVVELLGRSST